MREAFENALAANPDDLAGWCAFADYLTEQGDPRGEFMQTQIALEDESRPKAERDQLKAREAELLAAHEREWLGELAPFVLDVTESYRRTEARFARGWLTDLSAACLSVNMVRALGHAPEAKMLQRLSVTGTSYENAGDEPEGSNDTCYAPGPDVPDGAGGSDAPALSALTHCPRLAGIRVLRYGDGPTGTGDDGERHGSCHANGHPVHAVVAKMPGLEELYLYAYEVNAEELFVLPMPNLRVLRMEHELLYPLKRLAENPSLGNLTHLLCRPHAQRPDDPDAYIRLDQLRAVCRSPHLKSLSHLRLLLTDFGDEGADEIVASGVLKRLKVLELDYGCVTDRGAIALATCPDLKNLTRLDLSQNAIGGEGVAALRATGIAVNTDAQHGEHPDRLAEGGWLEYLSNGDME